MHGTDFTPAPSAYAYPLLVGQLLHAPLAFAPRREIVYADRLRYDYLTFRRRIGRLASALGGLGVRPGHTVAVMDWDSHRYLECFFAVPMLGAVLHTINVRLAPEQILYTINHAGDDVILVHADFVPIVEAVRDRIERPVTIVLLTDRTGTAATTLDACGEYEALLEKGDPEHGFCDFDENTRATTFYTTGTTGDPKGVWYTHRQVVLHALAVAAGAGTGGAHGRFHADDVYMPITPMFHVHAWGMPYVATLLGVKQVYPGRYVPETLLALIEREGVTFSHCVPTILHMLLESPAADRIDLTRWKVVLGGSALPSGLARAALARGIDVFAGYGMSETGPVLTLSRLEAADLDADPEAQLEIRCRTGRPIPLVDLRVVDEHLADVPADGATTGEVVVRAPWLTPGYVKDPERSKELWRDGYLHTGDIGHRDADGYLKITDRMKDVIKSGGEWVSSLAIEDLASRHPGVAEVAAIAVPDEKWGERPLVLVVPRASTSPAPKPEDIIAHLRGHADRGEISRWAVPERVLIVTEIAKTSVGKIDKKALRRRFADD